MGGTSGVLYDIFFTAAADKLAKVAKGKAPSVDIVLLAFSTGVQAMCQYGGARAGDRTMLDALVPALTMATTTYHVEKSLSSKLRPKPQRRLRTAPKTQRA